MALALNLLTYKTGRYYCSIKVTNNLPLGIKNLPDNTKQFKAALKRFLYTTPFSWLNVYFNTNNEWKFMLYYRQCSVWTNFCTEGF